MIEQINQFCAAFNKKPHIHSLLSSRQTVYLQIGGYFVEIADGTARVADGKDVSGTLFADITGHPEAIGELLFGTTRMRDLLNHGAVDIDAPFRTVLKLESIFLLVKEYQPEKNNYSLLTEMMS